MIVKKICPKSAGWITMIKQKNISGEKMINLSTNENPFGCSEKVGQAIVQELNKVSMYPELLGQALVEKLAAHLGIDWKRIFLGNGTDEVLRLITRGYIEHGDEVIMADVTFPIYNRNVLNEKGIPVPVINKNGVHNLDGMLKAITDKTKMIFVCNPNNPTGTIVGKETLRSFIGKVPSHILLVIDEAYSEYVMTEDYLDSLTLLDKHSNLIVLRTFSKMYGLAGLRVGYGVMDASLIPKLISVKDRYNTNRLAHVAAIAALDDLEFVSFCKKNNYENKKYLEQQFDQMKLSYYPSEANFIMVDVNSSADKVAKQLLEKGISVSMVDPTELPQSLRITIGTQEENEELIKHLRSIL